MEAVATPVPDSDSDLCSDAEDARELAPAGPPVRRSLDSSSDDEDQQSAPEPTSALGGPQLPPARRSFDLATTAPTVSSAVVPLHADDGDDDEEICRICRSGEEAGKLYCPCRCTGSIKWIHESCLSQWLRSQDRRPVCELCHYNFEFLPVYAQHAPQGLTLADWTGALGASAWSLGERLLRFAYATALWGIALPMLTVVASNCALSGRPYLLVDTKNQTLPLGAHIFLGECLSLAGILVIYISIVLRDFFPDLPAAGEGGETAEDGARQQQQQQQQHQPGAAAAAPASAAAQGEAVDAELSTGSSSHPSPSDSAPADPLFAQQQPQAAGEEDPWSQEEDLWVMMGLQGSPYRALQCMVTFFTANMIGIVLFLAAPYWCGRLTWRLLSPMLAFFPWSKMVSAKWLAMQFFEDEAAVDSEHVAPSPDFEGSMAQTGDETPNASAVVAVAAALSNATSWHAGLQPPGSSVASDIRALLTGYLALLVVFAILIPTIILVTSLFGCNVETAEALRRTIRWSLQQARAALSSGWLQLQMLATGCVQLVLVPCYVGHVVLCALAGPVLHVSQKQRATFANANLPLTMLMQLFIGYLHLWGCAFVEGCFIDVCAQWVSRQISSNFLLGALSSHRRVFGSPSLLDPPSIGAGAGTAAVGNGNRATGRPSGTASTGGGAGIGGNTGATAAAREGAGAAAGPPADPGEAGMHSASPRLMAMKLVLVHVALHTAVATCVWRPPAVALDALLGRSLFPLQFLERGHDGSPGVVRDNSSVLNASAVGNTSAAVNASAPANATAVTSAAGGAGEFSQPLFAVELLHLYILVLQCLRMLDASPGIARIVACGLRCTLRRAGLRHFLPAAAPATSAAQAAAREGSTTGTLRLTPSTSRETQPLVGPQQLLDAEPRAAPGAQDSQDGGFLPERPPSLGTFVVLLGQVSAIVLLLMTIAWGIVGLALSLPLIVGRTLVHQLLATHVRVSDVLPLSVGVTVLSASILAGAKLSEALPSLVAQARAVRHRRFVYLLVCGASLLAMTVATFVLVPLGLGALILRIVLPLKTRSEEREPITILLTDCWGIGLVVTKVMWHLLQTDTIMHSLRTELVTLWSESGASVAGLSFNLSAHRRLWRLLVLPMFEIIAIHLVFPQTVAHTMMRCFFGTGQELAGGTMIMYSYHIVLAMRLAVNAVPMICEWVTSLRQRIFDSKYLVSRELQNYGQGAAPDSMNDTSTATLAAS